MIMVESERIEVLEAENETLRARVSDLEAQLMAADGWHAPLEWQLTSAESIIIGVLVSRGMATKDAFLSALYRDFAKDEAEPKIVDVFVCKARKKLKPFGVTIETIWGQGYRLPEDQRAQLKAGAKMIQAEAAQ